jgi:two-component system sensor histidine kinase/response regulator
MKSNSMVLRLGVPFGILTSILLGLSWLGLNWMGQMDAVFETTIRYQWDPLLLSREALNYSYLNYRITTEVLLLNDKAEIDRLLARQAENSKSISSLLTKIRELGIEPGREQELIDAVQAARTPYLASRRRALNMLLIEHKSAEAREVMLHETLPLLAAYHDAWNAFTQLQVEQFNQANRLTRIHYARARRLFLFMIILSALLAASIAAPVTMGMSRAIARREKAEKDVSQLNADLEQKVIRRTEELSQLNENLAQDILERKRTQEALLASEERFRGLLESAPEAVLVVDSAARIVLVNAQTEQTYGYPRDELLGSKLEMLVPERDRHVVSKRFEARRRQPRPRGKEVGQERISRRKDGTEFLAAVNISYIEADEDFLMLSFVTDITARKHAEAELKAARDAAEAAAQAKSDFLANMSHEIRTPMNGVLGMAGLLLDTELNGEQREYAQTLRNSGEALLAIINDILDFSKIEAGKMTIEPIPFDLRVMAEETADLLASRAQEKELELILRFSPQAPRRVIGDPGRVRQILLNILGNALKFTDKGHIYLNVECLERTKEGVMLRFAVEDTGIGIAEEQISKIFERFSQADASTTRKFGGTGLGLSISQRLAALMGGTMGASSVPGKGSTFWFCLRMPLDLAGPVDLPRVADLSGVRILAVDDNATNRFVVHEQLNSWHLRNDVCESGPQALQILREAQAAADPYDIVVLDHQMPEMSGEELARAIKADPALQETVLVMLSSHGQRGDANRMKDAGFAAYLTKPVRQSQLFDALAVSWATRMRGERSLLITRHTLAESAAAPPQPPARTELVIRARILLVEDNAVNQKVAVRMLEKLGCRVDVAANGSEAVQMLELLPFDLVFMDCQMPVMDGYEATREIRRREGQRAHQIVVAMTANAMQGDREKCLQAGMDDYISKPINKGDLINALNRHLDAKHPSDLMPAADSGKASS